jgi:hypothetical protein
MNKYDYLHAFALDWIKSGGPAPPVSAELFTSGHLRNFNIKLRTLPVRFNRVRVHGVKSDIG